MPNIKITEQDLTRGGGRAVNRDIVYIPGFGGYNLSSIDAVSNNIPQSNISLDLETYQEATPAFPATSSDNKAFFNGNTWNTYSQPNEEEPIVVSSLINLSNYGIGVSGLSNEQGIYKINFRKMNDAWKATNATLTIEGGGTEEIEETYQLISLSGGSNGDIATVTVKRKYPLDWTSYEHGVALGVGENFTDLGFTATFFGPTGVTMSIIDKDYNYGNNNLVSTQVATWINDYCQDFPSFYINYISGDSYRYNDNMPHLCLTIDEFTQYFGKSPLAFPTNYAYEDGGNGRIDIQKGDFDKSWVEAYELISRGLPVLYHAVYPVSESIHSGTTTSEMIGYFYSNILGTNTSIDNPGTSINNLYSKSDYDVKYITCGAYPSFYSDNISIANKMLDIASNIGDVEVLIDHEQNKSMVYMPTSSPTSLFGRVVNLFGSNASQTYGTVMTPWYYYSTSAYIDTTSDSDLIKSRNNTPIMPASFGYLCALAESIKNNPNWYAIAGVNRGIVPNFRGMYLNKELNNTVANAMQPRDGATSINAITYIRPYGYAIWGNRTLKNNAGEGNLTATSFLNIRNMVCDIKKVVREVALGLLFEQDTPTLWINFVAGITPTLEKMRGTGLSNYRIIREATTEKAKVKATIRIYPLYAVEDFEINIELRDEEVIVE